MKVYIIVDTTWNDILDVFADSETAEEFASTNSQFIVIEREVK